jgi:hypothetical protein
MIEFQSSAIIKNQNHRTIILPLPEGEGRGSNERSERHFLCCSFVGESFVNQSFDGSDEGELNHRGRQSALIKVGRAYSRAVLKSFPMANPQNCETNPFSKVGWFKPFSFKVSQGHSRLLKAIQAYSRVFGKNIFLFVGKGRRALRVCLRLFKTF